MQSMIRTCCRRLKIGSTFYEGYDEIKAESHEEFLLKLLEREIEHRDLSGINRSIKKANFDVIKTFNGYSFADVEIPAVLDLEELKEARFAEKKENLILYGPVGTGKTHLATAIGMAACNRKKNVKFFRTAALINILIEAKTKGNLRRILKQLEKCDLLICDEWGYIPYEKEGAQLLFQVVSECYEKRSVIITTNLEFSRWNGIFYDEKMTTAIIDRLIHHGHLLVFKGKSYRLKNSKMNH